MRLLLTWLMIFGMLAGLNARVIAVETAHVTACSDFSEPCCQDHHVDAPASPLRDDGDHCPPDHHHDLCCGLHALPLAAEENPGCRLAEPASSMTGVRHESTVLPEGPYLGSEKPPLI